MVANPASAQVRDKPETPVAQQNGASTFSADDRVWRTGDVGSSQIGQRQTRDQVAGDTGIEPMGRIGSRIQSRVQSRIRNRIDRYYNPQANAVSPFIVAGIRRALPIAARGDRRDGGALCYCPHDLKHR